MKRLVGGLVPVRRSVITICEDCLLCGFHGGHQMSGPSPATLIDWVDKRNRPIGVVPRGSALELSANFRTVHVFVLSDQGDLLLQQLTPNRERHASLWGSSVAGYLFAGESYRDGARRRLSEEVGLSTPIRWQGILSMEDERSRKFVGLYTTIADDPVLGEPDQIAALEWRNLDLLVAETVSNPERFTPTFRHLLAFYMRSTRVN